MQPQLTPEPENNIEFDSNPELYSPNNHFLPRLINSSTKSIIMDQSVQEENK